MREAYDNVMRVLTEDHPALLASGGRLLSRFREAIRNRWAGYGPRPTLPITLEGAMKAFGIALLGFCALAYLDMWIYQATAGFTLGIERLRSASASSTPDRERTRLGYVEGQSMGWIEIPRLGVSAVVAHGDDSTTLRRAVGHIPGTAFPGEGGNVGLAGHRDTFFRALEEIRASDSIRLVMPEGVYAYRVEDVGIVRPQQTEVLDSTPVSTLTLVTCYPFEYIGSAPYRYIIRARELSGP